MITNYAQELQDILDSHEVQLIQFAKRVKHEVWGYLTSSEINALPPKVRDYIMNLETIADPTCLVRDAAIQRENAEALATLIADARRTLTCPHRSDATRVSDALKILRDKSPKALKP